MRGRYSRLGWSGSIRCHTLGLLLRGAAPQTLGTQIWLLLEQWGGGWVTREEPSEGSWGLIESSTHQNLVGHGERYRSETRGSIFQSCLGVQHLPPEPGSDLSAAPQCHRHLQPMGAGLRLCSQAALLLRNKGSKSESRGFGEGCSLQWHGGLCHISELYPTSVLATLPAAWHQHRFRWTAKKLLVQQNPPGRRM